MTNLLSFQYPRNLVGQRVWPAHGAPNQLLMAVHREFAKQDGKRIQVPLTHAARTSEAKKLQGSLTKEALGHGSDHLQPTGPVFEFAAQQHELAEDGLECASIILAKIGDGFEVRRKPAQ
jgi:hypothetical protein